MPTSQNRAGEAFKRDNTVPNSRVFQLRRSPEGELREKGAKLIGFCSHFRFGARRARLIVYEQSLLVLFDLRRASKRVRNPIVVGMKKGFGGSTSV